VSPFGSFTNAFDHVGVIGTYVDLERRREGIAARLFAATFEAARAKGYEKFFSCAPQRGGASNLSLSRLPHRRSS
jgi:GNAT superfamily N-acetyltransferase